TIYQGNNALLRFITFLLDGFLLARKAKQYKDTLIIASTSPPMLPFWCALLFGKNIRWGLWTFDLFPEGFQATGFIKKNNPFYRWVIQKTYSRAPQFLIALGPQQANHLQVQYKKIIPFLTLPCGVFFYQNKSEEKPA